MYDDLLGEKKSTPHLPKKTFWSGSAIKTLHYKVDTPTPNGRLYPKDTMEEALDEAIKRNLWLINKVPRLPEIVEINHIVGKCTGYNINQNNEILLDIKYLKGMSTYANFNVTTVATATVTQKMDVNWGNVGIVEKPLKIHQLYTYSPHFSLLQ